MTCAAGRFWQLTRCPRLGLCLHPRRMKNSINVNGSRMSRNTIPERSTTIVNARPASLVNVMSPNPNVDITVRAQ